MTPDPEQRLPRELLKELIEEGSDACRGVLEKLLNTAMPWNEKSFCQFRRWERSENASRPRYKAKTLSTRVGQIRIPQVRHLDFYRRSLERGCRSEKALKLAIAEMYPMGVSRRKVTEITEQLAAPRSPPARSRISKLLDDELEQFRNRPLGSWPSCVPGAHYKVRRQGSIQCGRLESDRSQLLGQAGGDWGQLPTQRGGGPLARVSAAASTSVVWRVCSNAATSTRISTG